MKVPVTETRPPEGWEENRLGRGGVITYVKHSVSIWNSPPKREGYECFFTARHATYTRWSYHPTGDHDETAD